ncbi:MAG: GNAT family N-acetyltransferase [Myxococcaceae bacterium]
MAISVRRLMRSDEAALELLVREDADFDIDGRGGDDEPLSAAEASRFLEDPAVLFWVAEADGVITGFLFCHVLSMRHRPARELLLYETGTRKDWRRKGVGRALMNAAFDWMKSNGIDQIWVLADNDGAAEFYRANGFEVPEDMALYMTRGD